MNDDSSSSEEHDDDAARIQHSLLLLRVILGRPYASHATFWTKVLPLTLIQGSMLGLIVACFLGVVNVFLELWISGGEGKHGGAAWLWIGVTTAGGLLSSLIFMIPGAPKPGMFRTIFHDVCDLKGSVIETPFLVVASMIALASGAPLGPELAIGVIGSGMATFLSTLLNLDRHTEAGLVQSGLVGSFGGLLLSPILGAVMVHELSVTGRPSNLLLDDTLTPFDIRVSRGDGHPLKDHGFMEQMTLGGVAATAAFVVFSIMAPLTFVHNEQWFLAIDLGQEYDNNTDNTFHLWHLAAAIPMGLVCAKLGILAIGLIEFFDAFRRTISNMLSVKLNLPRWLSLILFPTLAGLLHGIVSIWNPMLRGSGVSNLQYIVEQHVTVENVPWFMATAMCKIFSMSICLGFGLVGGPIFPVLFAGVCIGKTMTLLLPLSVAVPCCMCAAVGSFLPIPVTLVFYTAFSMSLSMEQIGPVFVAVFVAHCFVGGIGTIQRLGEKRLGYDSTTRNRNQGREGDEEGSHDLLHDDVFQYEALGENDQEDEQLAREVRDAIFGSNNSIF